MFNMSRSNSLVGTMNILPIDIEDDGILPMNDNNNNKSGGNKFCTRKKAIIATAAAAVIAIIIAVAVAVPLAIKKGHENDMLHGAAAQHGDDSTRHKEHYDNITSSSVPPLTPLPPTELPTTTTTTTTTTTAAVTTEPVTAAPSTTASSAAPQTPTPSTTSAPQTESPATPTSTPTTSTTGAAPPSSSPSPSPTDAPTPTTPTTTTTTTTTTTEPPTTTTACPPFPSQDSQNEVFDTTPVKSNLDGIDAEIRFAQAQTVPLVPKAGDTQPRLSALRTTLLMLRPGNTSSTFVPCYPVSVTVRNKTGHVVLANATMRPPPELPQTVYYNPLAPSDANFTVPEGISTHTYTLPNRQITDKNSGQQFADWLENVDRVLIRIVDGGWSASLYLPKNNMTLSDGRPVPNAENKYIEVYRGAGYGSTVYYDSDSNFRRSAGIPRGSSIVFRYKNGAWFQPGDVEQNKILYARNMYSLVLDGPLITPNMTLEFYHAGAKGTPNAKINVGPPTQLLINGLDIGLLTSPRGVFTFTFDKNLSREYYQRLPVSQYIATEYDTVHWTEVMMPNGNLLTDFDPSTGTVYAGNMRSYTTKALISTGIDLANFGIPCLGGTSEWQPYTTAQLTAYNSVGKYVNGVVVHGLSGGNGKVTLSGSSGNEVSHETGHNYGMGHYPNGFAGSVHRPPTEINSAWAWDSDRDLFLPNFWPDKSGRNMSCCNYPGGQEPFYGRTYGKDAMAGGAVFSSDNRFTQYTPFTMNRIQRFFEQRSVFDKNSPTGYSRFNTETLEMEPAVNYIDRYDYNSQGDAAVMGVDVMRSLLLRHKTVLVSIRNDNDVDICDPASVTEGLGVPAGSLNGNRTRILILWRRFRSGNNITFHNGSTIFLNRWTKLALSIQGEYWVRIPVDIPSDRRVMTPQYMGVPVITVLGYYDPIRPAPSSNNTKQSYLFPTLHGGFGITYYNDSDVITTAECHLRVDTRQSGPFLVRLSESRLQVSLMNKIHVHVPKLLEPYNTSVWCYGSLLAWREVTPSKRNLTYYVEGDGKLAQW